MAHLLLRGLYDTQDHKYPHACREHTASCVALGGDNLPARVGAPIRCLRMGYVRSLHHIYYRLLCADAPCHAPMALPCEKWGSAAALHPLSYALRVARYGGRARWRDGVEWHCHVACRHGAIYNAQVAHRATHYAPTVGVYRYGCRLHLLLGALLL